MASQDELANIIVIDDFVSFSAISPNGIFTKLAPSEWRSNPDDVRGCVVFEKLVCIETWEFWCHQIRGIANKAAMMTAAAVVIGTTREVADEIQKRLSRSPPLPIVFCTDEALIHQLHGGLGQKKVFLTPLKPGDHIRRKLKGRVSLGYHHGIYVGGGQVVHFTNETPQSGMVSGGQQAKILKETIEKFKDGFSIELVDGRYDCKAAVQRALSAVNDKAYSDNYQLFKNNCEHFARWCCTGVGFSTQVMKKSKGIYMEQDRLANAIVIDDFMPFGTIPSRGLFAKLAPHGWMSNPDEVAGRVVFEKLVSMDTWDCVSKLRALVDKASKMEAAAVIVGTTARIVKEIERRGQSTTGSRMLEMQLPVVFCVEEMLIEELYSSRGQKMALITPVPLHPGDRIKRETERNSSWYHHAIYVGGGRVVRCATVDLRLGAVILETAITDFVTDGSFHRVVHNENYNPRVAVERAMAALDGAYPNAEYDLMANNTEDFVTWCCTGRYP